MNKFILFIKIYFFSISDQTKTCSLDYGHTYYIEANMENPILFDIKHVIKQLNLLDLFQGLKNVLIQDFIKDTIWDALKKFPYNAWNSIKTLFKFLKSPIKSSVELLNDVKCFFKSIIHLSLSEKLILISKLIISYYLVRIGYYTPDLDIKLWGIGSHRHFSTHSIIPLLGVIFGFKVIKRVGKYIYSLLPQNKNQIWQDLKNFGEQLKFIPKAYSLGLGLHLAEDLFIDGSQSIRGPWGGTFIKGTYLDDDAYIAMNIHESLYRAKE